MLSLSKRDLKDRFPAYAHHLFSCPDLPRLEMNNEIPGLRTGLASILQIFGIFIYFFKFILWRCKDLVLEINSLEDHASVANVLQSRISASI